MPDFGLLMRLYPVVFLVVFRFFLLEIPAKGTLLIDATGFKCPVISNPHKIITLIPSATEICYALGLKQAMMAVSDNDNYPPEVNELPRIGGLQVNAEKIIAINPQVVIAEKDLNAQAIGSLRNLNLRVFAIHAENLKQVQQNILLLGRLFSRANQADSLVKSMERQKKMVASIIRQIPEHKRKKVFIEHFPGLYTAGKGTFMHEIITLAGGNNIASGISLWGRMTEEEVLKSNPDVILYTTGHLSTSSEDNIQMHILKRSSWRWIKAIKSKAVYGIDMDLISRPSPRLTKGLSVIAKTLYPDKFENVD